MSRPITDEQRVWWVATDDPEPDLIMGPFPYRTEASLRSGWIERGLRKVEAWANSGWVNEWI